MNRTRVLVLGGGPAAHRFTEQLAASEPGRDRFTVTVLGAEQVPAYNRALLTSVLDGTLPPGALRLSPLPPGTEVLLGTAATLIDRQRRMVLADDGVVHPYDVLVLATGAAAHAPARSGLCRPDGSLHEGVRVLRTLRDCSRIRPGPAVVAGGGPLAIEAALALRRGGRDVTLVHRGGHPLDRRLDAHAGRLLAGHLVDQGVHVRLGHRITDTGPGWVALDGDCALPADTVLLCAGVRPRSGLARQAGLGVAAAGILTDAFSRTTDPYIYAIGDCALPQTDVLHRGYAAACEQADRAAAQLLGEPVPGTPAAPVLRLKSPGLDLACMGRADARSGVETLEADPDSGGHARVLLHGGRVVGATLLGLPRLTAQIARHFRRGDHLPDTARDLLRRSTSTR